MPLGPPCTGNGSLGVLDFTATGAAQPQSWVKSPESSEWLCSVCTMSKFGFTQCLRSGHFQHESEQFQSLPRCFSFTSPTQLCCICLGQGPAEPGPPPASGQGLAVLPPSLPFPSVLSLALFLLLIRAGKQQGFTCSPGSAAKWLQATFILTTKDGISAFGCLKPTQTLTAAAE